MRAYIFTALLVILLWNGALIKRDTELMKAYDEACALTPSHPRCPQ